MRILIISDIVWKLNNSFGNTASNLYKHIDDIEIAHIYLDDNIPDKEPFIKRYFQIPESSIIKSVFRRRLKHNKVGAEIFPFENSVLSYSAVDNHVSGSWYSKLLSFGKKHHWRLMFWGRDFAWKHGQVNYEALVSFVKDFNPDIFVLPYFYVYNVNHLALYIKKYVNVPMVTSFSMDHYSLKRFSLSPLFWIDRFSKRAMIRKLAKESEFFFVISDKLKQELESELGVPCRVQYKISDEKRCIQPYSRVNVNKEIMFLFTGNIYANRWKTLSMLVKELNNQKIGRLDIYTSTPITSKMKKALCIPGVSEIHPPVSSDRVVELQNEADVLVHVEAFDKFNKSLVRCAISTKIMDYLSVGRCILAIGPDDISSIEYLVENDTALVASDCEQLHGILEKMKENHDIVAEYATKGLTFAKEHLNAEQKRKELYDNLQEAMATHRKRVKEKK